MCRFLAYSGEPIFLEDIITKPVHSLIHQSLHANEAKMVTNGDGFGVGWYAERPDAGLYRELRPAWSDENLIALCRQVRSHLFFGHIRAATDTATARANCHPFTYDRYMFMHNGQVGCYDRLKRRLENLIPDALYGSRSGSGDSEILFLIAMGNGAAHDPIGAFARTLEQVKLMMGECGICQPLRFAATFTDGEDIYAFRWSCDDKAPTLYYRQDETAIMIASEPIDSDRHTWTLVPQAHAVIAKKGQAAIVSPFQVGWKIAA